jgi:hypothetical protein
MSDLAGGLASSANAAPAAPAAPAPSAPASQPASSAPSLSEAFQQFGVGEESGAASEQPTVESPAPAIVEPPTAEPSAEELAGPIPFERHKAVLESTRKKAAEESVQQFREQYRDALSFAEAFEANPIETAMHLMNQLQTHPEHGKVLRSHVARLLAQRQQQAPAAAPAAEPEPQADVLFNYSDGTQGRTYSDEQLRKWQQWNATQQEQRIAKQFEPLRQLQEQVTRQREQQKQTSEYVQKNTPLANELREMPGFKEHVQEIQAKQAELFQQTPNADPLHLWFRAYREIVPAKLQAQQQQQLVTSALNKSAGRDSNPASVVSSPPPTSRDLRELMAQMGLR